MADRSMGQFAISESVYQIVKESPVRLLSVSSVPSVSCALCVHMGLAAGRLGGLPRPAAALVPPTHQKRDESHTTADAY